VTQTLPLPRPESTHSAAVGDRSTLERLTEAIDAHRVGPRLAAGLDVSAKACHVLDAKFHPGAGATVLYELDGRLVRADLVPGHDGPVPAGAILVAPGLRLHPFPHDPDLPSLAAVMAPARVGPVLAEALGTTAWAAGTASGARWRTSLLRYRPGKRATILLTDRPQRRSYVAKVYHDPAKAAAVASEGPVLESVSRSAVALRFAPVVTHLPRLSTVVLGEVTGTPLGPLLSGARGPTGKARTAVRRAAGALAELHDRSPVSARQRPVDQELHRFVQRASAISEICPSPGEALLHLAERLADQAVQLPDPEVGTVHGDCKPSQVLLAGREVYLLDVDHLGVSDLAADVGTFMASLRQLAVQSSCRSPEATEAYHDLAEAFRQEYVEARSRTPEVERIRWQEAVALERKALRAFARAPRSPLVAGLVTEAHRRLDRLGGGGSHG
jgi:hypothetical protein